MPKGQAGRGHLLRGHIWGNVGVMQEIKFHRNQERAETGGEWGMHMGLRGVLNRPDHPRRWLDACGGQGSDWCLAAPR